jgi:signal transduction histidine kinase
MHIILVSEDQELRKLCNDVLNEFPRLDWQLTMATPPDWPRHGDLYIWDDHGRTAPPPDVDPAWPRHLFVVHRDQIANCWDTPEAVSASAILLKPVTRACLAAFLELATSAAQERTLSANSLRADRDDLLQCLIQSNLRIQRYDQDRTNFLARAVHDFRAPLMTAEGYCGLLLSGAMGTQNEEQQEVLRRMQHSIKRLSRMASAMFEMSIGTQVERAPELRPADIRECAQQALHEIGPLADGKRISISVDLDSETGPLLIEPGQMEQVLINILENACKFTPRGGEIELCGRPYFWDGRRPDGAAAAHEPRSAGMGQPNSYRIDIRDSGPRIPPEHLAEIFEEYTSYGGGPDRSGGGLGLAICKMILSSHGGRVWAENSDFGPRFSFVLPWRAAQTAAAAAREETVGRLGTSGFATRATVPTT